MNTCLHCPSSPPPSPLLLAEIAEYVVRAPHLRFDSWFRRCDRRPALVQRPQHKDDHDA